MVCVCVSAIRHQFCPVRLAIISNGRIFSASGKCVCVLALIEMKVQSKSSMIDLFRSICKCAFKISGPRVHSIGAALQIAIREMLAAVLDDDNDLDCEYLTIRKTIEINSVRECVVCSVGGGLVEWSITANKMVHNRFETDISSKPQPPKSATAQVHTKTCIEYAISCFWERKRKIRWPTTIRRGWTTGHMYKFHFSGRWAKLRPLSCAWAHALNANCMYTQFENKYRNVSVR